MPRGLIKMWSPYATEPAPQPVQFFNTTVAPDLGRGSVLPSFPLYVDNKPNEDTGDVAIEGTQSVFQDTLYAYINAHEVRMIDGLVSPVIIEVSKEPTGVGQLNTLFGGATEATASWIPVGFESTPVTRETVPYWSIRLTGSITRGPATMRVSF